VKHGRFSGVVAIPTTEDEQPKHLPSGHSPAFELLLKFAKERGIIKEKETGEGKDARRTG
jgi:hypothetical protein